MKVAKVTAELRTFAAADLKHNHCCTLQHRCC